MKARRRTSAEETAMKAFTASHDEDAREIDDGPGMLASATFWWGGLMSAGLWTLLLRAVA
jgi:hypothetical protein